MYTYFFNQGLDVLLTEFISLSNTNIITYNKEIVDKLLIIIGLK